MTRSFKFTITLTDLDNSVREADAREYILDAVESMGGCRHPDDPFFSMNGKVRITRAPNRKPKPQPQARP